MPQYEFGSGVLVGIQNPTDGSIATPREFGVLQEASVDFAATSKQLFGQYQFPVAVGRGTAKITGRARFARIYGAIYNDLFFNGTQAPGQIIEVTDEAQTSPATPFTLTIDPPDSGVFEQDLGVKLASDGTFLTRTDDTTPSAGFYYVDESTGAYTFNAADIDVLISYTYTVATGSTVTITNPLLGTAPSFQLHLKQSFQGRNLYLKLNRCISTKLGFATKLEDFQIPELDFEAFADDSNTVGVLSLQE